MQSWKVLMKLLIVESATMWLKYYIITSESGNVYKLNIQRVWFDLAALWSSISVLTFTTRAVLGRRRTGGRRGEGTLTHVLILNTYKVVRICKHFHSSRTITWRIKEIILSIITFKSNNANFNECQLKWKLNTVWN